MSDTPVIPPEQGAPPRSYGNLPSAHVDYADIPPGITLKPDEIVPKHPVFVVSVLVMVLTSLITFYMPLFNGLLGGTFGGYHAGRMKRALAAAVVTSVVVPAILAFAHLMSEQPGLLFLSGLTRWEWVALHVVGTFLGAISGAASRPLLTEREQYQRV